MHNIRSVGNDDGVVGIRVPLRSKQTSSGPNGRRAVLAELNETREVNGANAAKVNFMVENWQV